MLKSYLLKRAHKETSEEITKLENEVTLLNANIKDLVSLIFS